jgi:N-acetylmuramoyl-L-alanine amidase
LRTSSSQRRLRWAALLFLVALPGSMAHARVRHSEAWAREHFSTAERMREALNGRPPADRSRRDYQRVLNAYRFVYLGAPASSKADPSVVAVAETLVEMGRRFDDDTILKSAIAQYKFLRREYPGSRYRFDALFTIGEIYKDDLDHPDEARATFRDFLHRYPHNRLAPDARAAIADLNQRAANPNANANTKTGLKETANARDSRAAKEEKEKEEEKSKDTGAKEQETQSTKASSHRSGGDRESDEESKSTGARATDRDAKGDLDETSDTSADEANDDSNPPAPAKTASAARRTGGLPRVTGIRHWSTPDYTRVAIDVESEVHFSSERIARPDRIYFDLRDTKLASTLVGKSFDVDDGFLKKIRVAQYQPGRTRIVLEVDDLSSYNAFLLPDPYRLIIDIHGKDVLAKTSRRNRRADDATNARASQSGTLPEGTRRAEVPAPPKPVGADDPSADDEVSVSQPAAAVVAKTEFAKIDGKNSTPVKRVIVDNDPDPSTEEESGDVPVGAAKLDASKSRSHASSSSLPASKKNVNSAKDFADDSADSAAASSSAGNSDASGDSTVADDAPAPTRAGSRSAHANKNHKATADLEIREAAPTAHGDRSLIRALGLKIGRIVIDPGHGGHDTGTIGPNGLEEKDLVLDVGRRLGKLLETRLGAEVVYTRKDDTFIPLETRTAIANKQRADLFISIHANSSHDSAARGVETYYLNFTSSPEALEVAARENAVSEKSIYELQDLVKKIALKEKIEESREFAGDVQESLHNGLAAKSPAIRDRGVKKAPFIVLIGANMPSILAEISFVSNPTDEHRLETGEYRQQIADSLYRGIARYANGLSGVKVASTKVAKTVESKP